MSGARFGVGLSLVLAAVLGGSSPAIAGVKVVAAESTYGVVVQAIGGSEVEVNSIIRNPDVDPHDFEATPGVARDVAQARVVVMNGLGYDGWMEKLLKANPVSDRAVVTAADLDPARVLPDRNPHIFYDAPVMLRVARQVADVLSEMEPSHAPEFKRNLERFTAQIGQFDRRVALLRQQTHGVHVAATAPVYGYMLAALDWHNANMAFQTALMNGTEPSPADVARFEDSIRQHRVMLLIHNEQVESPVSRRLIDLAHQSGVPTVAVAEFVPPGMDYIAWQNHTLDAVEKALKQGQGR